MKNLVILLLVSIGCFAFIQVTLVNKDSDHSGFIKDTRAYKIQFATGCSPNLSSINFDDSTNRIPLLDGWGKYRMPVTVTNDSAAIYFQQGINMYYGFHIIEALASFEKAIQFEENFAMGYWGKALAFGPNINDLNYATAAEAQRAIAKAKVLNVNGTPVESALIDAMMARFSTDTNQKREALDQLYANAMKNVHNAFPNSADAAALYADALMVQHPWDLYDRYYNPKPWTPEIVGVLEKLVKQFPDNPGASHYYIHAIEGSKHPQKALEVADRLGALMPGLAHLVHMPSHIYIRSGYYDKGVAVNADAVKNYYNYLSKYPLTLNSAFIYLVHNQHMQAACAAMDAQYSNSLTFSKDTRNSVDSTWLVDAGYFGVYAQYMFMTPFFTWIRFGKWNEILKEPAIPESWFYANMMSHFARGIAYARKNQFAEAEKEMQGMLTSKSNPQLKESPIAFNPGIAAVEVAEKILRGVIAEERKQFSLSAELLEEAVNLEDGMLYNEPKDWLLPARQYLGYSLLKAKNYVKAEKVYKEDLQVNPNNAWSLTGLEKALKKQNKNKEAEIIQQRLRTALARSDLQITGSVF